MGVPLESVVDPDDLQRAVSDGLVKETRDDRRGLRLYNYTARAQYQRVWTPATRLARGLVVDSDDRIVARPFPKFHNLAEHHPDELPHAAFDVFDKVDGSLGILVVHDGEVLVVTRGAFDSDQAEHATAWYRRRYGTLLPPEGVTWLFEIVYPGNRIVVDYGDRDELVWLGGIDIATGADVDDAGAWPGPRAERLGRYEAGDRQVLADLADRGGSNREGFVVRFAAPAGTESLRVKVKLADYVRLHRIVTGVSTTSIWEHLKDGRDLDELYERVPDEVYRFVHDTVTELQAGHDAVLAEARRAVAAVRHLPTRKDQALALRRCRYPGVAFALLDGKDPTGMVWRLLRPEHRRYFSANDVD